MQKKTFAALFFTLLLIISCNKPHQTTGIVTQQAEIPDGQKIEQLKQMAQTNPAAAYDMGLRYLRGDGVAQSSYQAIEAFRVAAEKGDLTAQVTLGKLYLSGIEEMGTDLQEAEKWLTITAARGNKEGSRLLKQVQKSRKNKGETKIDYGYPYDWYYYTPYRLYWHHSLWRYW